MPRQNLQIGERVWLDSDHLSLPRPKKKLDDKRVGPFEIIEKAGASAYKLRLPQHWKIHPRFNEKLLTPYVPPHFLIRNYRHLHHPILSTTKKNSRSKKFLILDHARYAEGRERSLARPWTTLSSGKDGHKSTTWVRNEEMGNAQEAIEEYEERTNSVRRLDAVKIVTRTHQNTSMILDHEYQNDGNRSLPRSMG